MYWKLVEIVEIHRTFRDFSCGRYVHFKIYSKSLDIRAHVTNVSTSRYFGSQILR